MMEKTPSSVSKERRRGEMMWMPEKARGSGEWRVWHSATEELELIAEDEEAGGFAGLDGQGGEGALFVVELEHAAKVDGADDVDVVEEEGLTGTCGGVRRLIAVRLRWHLARIPCFARNDTASFIFGTLQCAALTSTFEEKPRGFFQAPSGVEQEMVFAGDFEAHAEIVVRLEVIDHPIGKMMDVNDDLVDAKSAKPRESDFEERAAVDFDKGFGARIGERAQARAEAGGEDHGFHRKRINTENA